MSEYKLTKNEEGITYLDGDEVYLITDHVDELNKLQTKIKELKSEVGKWLSHVTKMDDKLEILTECNAIEGVDEASPFCYCQGCSNRAFIENR